MCSLKYMYVKKTKKKRCAAALNQKRIVYCIKYQLTSSLTQFIAYFKYSIIESCNPQCTVRNCFVCA